MGRKAAGESLHALLFKKKKKVKFENNMLLKKLWRCYFFFFFLQCAKQDLFKRKRSAGILRAQGRNDSKMAFLLFFFF